ncbi:MAG TPA: polysaccharide deacetylase family protein [Candidatus Binatia bacterium]|jgi:peptidoglycan/xylan/chitin deacetylase (PgdA/CDA1 family)|nr:polysaccharide deacetylase family protein [Candidatus Binatia bacterium]
MLGWFWPLVFLGRAQRKVLERGAPILTYHKIGEPPPKTRDPFLYAGAETFDQHFRMLGDAGLRPVSLSQLITNLDDAKQVAITFDDGFRSVLDSGLEVLARHKVCAIQFLVTSFIGKRNEWDIEKQDVPEPLMDAAQIKEWLGAGHEIGSHSATHRNLKKLSQAEAREEISGSKKALEDQFGVPVRHFCYPFGGWTPAVRDLVAEAGYSSACSVQFGVNDAGADRFALRRIIPLSGAEVVRKVIHRLGRKVGYKS